MSYTSPEFEKEKNYTCTRIAIANQIRIIDMGIQIQYMNFVTFMMHAAVSIYIAHLYYIA